MTHEKGSDSCYISMRISIYHFSKDEFLSVSMLLQRDRFFLSSWQCDREYLLLQNLNSFADTARWSPSWLVLSMSYDRGHGVWGAQFEGPSQFDVTLRLFKYFGNFSVLYKIRAYYLASFLYYWINVFRKQKWRKSWELEAWSREMISSWRLHSYRVVGIVIYFAVEYY